MNTVVCVRHGETAWKREGRTQGQRDSPLTPVGIEQARALAAKLATEPFGRLLTSPLGRAVQTAEILAGQLAISELREVHDLAERGEGAFEGLTRQEQIDQYPRCFDRAGDVDWAQVPGVEPLDRFLNRVQRGLAAMRRVADDTGVLVVTHAGVMQALVSIATGEDYAAVCARRTFAFCETLRIDPL